MKSDICLSASSVAHSAVARVIEALPPMDEIESYLKLLGRLPQPMTESVHERILDIFGSDGYSPRIRGLALEAILHHAELRRRSQQAVAA